MWHKKHKRTKKVSYEVNLPLWLYESLVEIKEFENVSLSKLTECGILYANGWGSFERSKKTLQNKKPKKSKAHPKKKSGQAYQQGVFAF